MHSIDSSDLSQNNFNDISKLNKLKEDWPLDERFTFEKFVVGSSNELAFASAKSMANPTNNYEYNPLYIYGGVGLGKTHLMHAIAWHVNNNPDLKVIYLSAERFMFQFIKSAPKRHNVF